MGKQLIIAVSREFGSGGHEIADILAKKFNIPIYDNNLLTEIANSKNLDVDTLEKYDEKPKNIFLSRSVRGYSNSLSGVLAQMQFDYIRELANKGESFVIVGRCAETVLKIIRHLSLYLYWLTKRARLQEFQSIMIFQGQKLNHL